jgi:lipopolysaccharide/colanic/teichoic acid biosynthesis glycosyltransferase
MTLDADKILKETLASDEKAQKEWSQNFKLKNDPRITKIGQFLRKTSLDELPQLWNVLKGEMSLVGPRPIIEEEIEMYGDQSHYYIEVNPGITGLWQISGRNDIDYQRRIYLDGWYVRNWSLWYDIVIMLKSLPIVIRGKGAY